MAFGEPPTRLRVDPHSEAQQLTSLGLELTELLGRTLKFRGESSHFVAARAQHGARWDRQWKACTRHREQPARVHLRLHLALEMDEALLGLGQRALRQLELVRALVELVTCRTQLRIELGERRELLGVRLLLRFRSSGESIVVAVTGFVVAGALPFSASILAALARTVTS